jgi:DNA-binding NtrC family response regulator
VEDQPALRALAEQQLRELGYQLSSFSSAEDALRGLGPQLASVDLVVTDIVLQGESGGALVQRLRSERPDLRVLYMSGYADELVLLRGVDTRSSHFLHKPFSLKDLAQAVRRALSSPLEARDQSTIEARGTAREALPSVDPAPREASST